MSGSAYIPAASGNNYIYFESNLSYNKYAQIKIAGGLTLGTSGAFVLKVPNYASYVGQSLITKDESVGSDTFSTAVSKFQMSDSTYSLDISGSDAILQSP